MRNSCFTSDDHDPGDEDPTERVKRALLEVLEEVPPRHLMSRSGERLFAAMVTPGETVRIRTTSQLATDAEDLL